MSFNKKKNFYSVTLIIYIIYMKQFYPLFLLFLYGWIPNVLHVKCYSMAA